MVGGATIRKSNNPTTQYHNTCVKCGITQHIHHNRLQQQYGICVYAWLCFVACYGLWRISFTLYMVRSTKHTLPKTTVCVSWSMPSTIVLSRASIDGHSSCSRSSCGSVSARATSIQPQSSPPYATTSTPRARTKQAVRQSTGHV